MTHPSRARGWTLRVRASLGELHREVEYELGSVAPATTTPFEIAFGPELKLHELAENYVTVANLTLVRQGDTATPDGHQDLGQVYLAWFEGSDVPEVWSRVEATELAPWGLLQDPDGVGERLRAAGVPEDGFLAAPIRHPSVDFEPAAERLFHPADWHATPEASPPLGDPLGVDTDTHRPVGGAQ